MNDIARVALNKIGTVRSTAAALFTPKSTLYRNFQRSKIRRHRNAGKPSFTLSNMAEREEFYKANIKDDKTTFHDIMNIIHPYWWKVIYLPKNSRRYYLGVQESESHWTARSKRYCIKVMFLAAIAYPRWNPSVIQSATLLQNFQSINDLPLALYSQEYFKEGRRITRNRDLLITNNERKWNAIKNSIDLLWLLKRFQNQE